jgi:hypothetical protein
MVKTKHIWIDTDMALGANRGDVDDGFALAAVLAAASSESNAIKIEGISPICDCTTKRIDGSASVRAADKYREGPRDQPHHCDQHMFILGGRRCQSFIFQAAAIEPQHPQR